VKKNNSTYMETSLYLRKKNIQDWISGNVSCVVWPQNPTFGQVNQLLSLNLLSLIWLLKKLWFINNCQCGKKWGEKKGFPLASPVVKTISRRYLSMIRNDIQKKSSTDVFELFLGDLRSLAIKSETPFSGTSR